MSISSSNSQEEFNKWFFTDEQLNNPPSVQLGMTLEDEQHQREKAAGHIRQITDGLWPHMRRPNLLCTTTAIVFMHRFYMYHPFQKFPAHVMARCALFLACKSEEQPIKLEYVIKTSFLLDNPNLREVPENEKSRLANELIRNENLLLQTIGYEFTIDHPHKVIIEAGAELNISKIDVKLAYDLATNSLHFTKMCLKYDHRNVAIVCLKIALKTRDLEIEPREWWTKTSPDLTAEQLEKMSNEYVDIINRLGKTFQKWLQMDKPNQQSKMNHKPLLQHTTDEPTTPDSGVSSLRS